MDNRYLQMLSQEILHVSNLCYCKLTQTDTPYDEWAMEARDLHDMAMRVKALAESGECDGFQPFDQQIKELRCLQN